MHKNMDQKCLLSRVLVNEECAALTVTVQGRGCGMLEDQLYGGATGVHTELLHAVPLLTVCSCCFPIIQIRLPAS